MVSTEKAFLFFSLLKAIFQLLEIWLVNPFPAPKSQKTHYLHNLGIRKKVGDPFRAPSFSVKNKKGNKTKTSNFLLFLWLTIYACKMGAPHCSSAPFMSDVPWIESLTRWFTEESFNSRPPLLPAVRDGHNRGVSCGISAACWQAGVRAVRWAPCSNTNQPQCSFTIHI